MRSNKILTNRNGIVFTLLFLIILIVYSNTFNVPWHFDDYPNIYNNQQLQITDLRPQSLFRTFFAYPVTGNTFYRPLPMMTFAINWYFGKDRVIGYHIVNTLIHILNAFFLFLTIRQILRSPNLKLKCDHKNDFIALFAATLWAVHPIQIQGVTLIVQLMTSMAAMFYILGIYFYFKARNGDSHVDHHRRFFFLCFISFVLSIGCKENTITFPIALFLVESIFYQDPGSREFRKKMLPVLLGACLITFSVVLLLLLLMKENPILLIVKGYDIRPFALMERLMTEARVLVFYLSQIFYPVADRFSFSHDFTISVSLMKPWSTLPSILFICTLIIVGILKMKRWPIISFGILFFFLGHSVTATILPMEIIFEHRNYLASMFLFIPIAVGINKMLHAYRTKNYSMYLLILFFVPAIIIGFGWSTYIRNSVWASEKSLWEDAMAKAPLSGRPPYRLALWYADGRYSGFHGETEKERQARLEKALSLLERAAASPIKVKKYSYAQLASDMGDIYYLKGDFRKAREMYQQARHLDPKFGDALPGMVRTLIKFEKWTEALENCELILLNKPNHLDTLKHTGLILLETNRPVEAIRYFAAALKLAYENRTLMYLGMAYQAIGRDQTAERFMQRALYRGPDRIEPLLVLIDHSLKSGKMEQADSFAQRLLDLYPVNLVTQRMDEISRDSFYLPISFQRVRKALAEKLNRISGTLYGK